jgi:hypothetical protein
LARAVAGRAIGTRSLALDVYVWLAYRLHSLTRPTPVTWAALHGQFGAGFKVPATQPDRPFRRIVRVG